MMQISLPKLSEDINHASLDADITRDEEPLFVFLDSLLQMYKDIVPSDRNNFLIRSVKLIFVLLSESTKNKRPNDPLL